MKNYNPEMDTRFINCINSMSLKKWHNHNNLVLDVENKEGTTLEDILLGLDNIKTDAEQYLGYFDNIDIRLQ